MDARAFSFVRAISAQRRVRNYGRDFGQRPGEAEDDSHGREQGRVCAPELTDLGPIAERHPTPEGEAQNRVDAPQRGPNTELRDEARSLSHPGTESAGPEGISVALML
jgi:hypothetical protein